VRARPQVVSVRPQVVSGRVRQQSAFSARRSRGRHSSSVRGAPLARPTRPYRAQATPSEAQDPRHFRFLWASGGWRRVEDWPLLDWANGGRPVTGCGPDVWPVRAGRARHFDNRAGRRLIVYAKVGRGGAGGRAASCIGDQHWLVARRRTLGRAQRWPDNDCCQGGARLARPHQFRLTVCGLSELDSNSNSNSKSNSDSWAPPCARRGAQGGQMRRRQSAGDSPPRGTSKGRPSGVETAEGR